ncbi:MAG: hypothetical protein ACTSVK_04820 [Promethearchaeota archaeon]
MWILTPLFGMIFGFIFLSIVMVCKVWFPSKISSKNHIMEKIALGWKGIIGAIYSYYGILLLNTIIKVIFGGILSYGNFWFYLMSILLLSVLAAYLLLSGVFKAPTWHTLFSFLAILAFTIYYFEFYLEYREINKYELLSIPMFMSIGVFLGTMLLTLPIRIMKARRTEKSESSLNFKNLWDISLKVEKWINIKTLGILWILFAIETFLLLEGLSLLYWIGLIF